MYPLRIKAVKKGSPEESKKHARSYKLALHTIKVATVPKTNNHEEKLAFRKKASGGGSAGGHPNQRGKRNVNVRRNLYGERRNHPVVP